MLLVIFQVLTLITPIWVYWDATNKRIGKKTNQKGFLNISAGAWSVATLGLWIIAFPLYLIKRNTLIKAAKEHPVDVTKRTFKLVILISISTIWSLLIIFNYLNQ